MRIDEMPDYRAQLPKSVHDLSHKFGFTATVAHLLPVFHDILNPGETVDLSFRYNLRTQPLASAAMVDIKAHVEYFFVPMFLLYEPFGSMFYDVQDQFSSLYPDNSSGTRVQDSFPVMDFWEPHTTGTMEDLIYTVNQNQTAAREGEVWYNQLYRLFDHLCYNNDRLVALNSDANFNPNVFPWPILAYNCIYQYYYRLDTRERFIQSQFNWDKFYNTQVVGNSDWNFIDNVRLRTRPIDNDYFTDNKVSPIVDVLNLNSKSQFELAQQWLSRSQLTSLQLPVLSSGSVGNSSTYAGSPSATGNSPSSNIQSNFGYKFIPGSDAANIPLNGLDINTANIRAMFANEKFWSITGRARKHYDDQTLAHFGIKVPHDVKHQISCFGHDTSNIHIGEVISTSNVGVSSSGSIQSGGLGEIAGKGYGSMNNKPHRFTAPCHGVVMAILSFAPDYTYGKTYLKANAVTSRQDLYIPSYDHLGMQPLFGYEGYIEQGATIRNKIVGWQYRYEQWKRRYNRVSHAFTGAGSLDSWMLDYRPVMSTNAVQQPDANTPNAPLYYGYHYHPWDLDQIMLVNYVTASGASNPDNSIMYDGDPFVVDGYIYCKKRSTMSDYSLPRLDA